MAKTFLKLITNNKPQIQEPQQTPNNLHHFIFNLQKTKDNEKMLKEARWGRGQGRAGGDLLYGGTRIKILSDFSSESTSKESGEK